VLSMLGAGGMGVVYAAYDPELDRKVALKLLLPEAGGGTGAESTKRRARLLREARALAKLQHANVVTIHDVGTHDGRVWLAMEYVEGRTLRVWMSEAKRTWIDVLRVLADAGRGVAAAHRAGLLHRDLKPDNVMVGDDGRVLVMDFGLARSEDGPTPEPGAVHEGSAAEPNCALTRFTRGGALVGTPAYMAPEQFREEAVGAAADQFSFCVMLWEALFGTRPFSGKTLADIAVSVLESKPQLPPARLHVPRWLRQVLERGLSRVPGDRWPSMDALLDTLERGRERSRWRRGLGIAAAVGLVVAGFVGWQAIEAHRRAIACEKDGARIAEFWNDEARLALRRVLVDTGVGYAEATADRVTPWLDRHASEWEATRTEACMDAEVRASWDADLLDRSRWCLDERRMEFEALVSELSRAGERAVRDAVPAAAALAPVTTCGDPDVLRRLPEVPHERRDEIRAIRAELSGVWAKRRTGAYQEGLADARDVLERAKSVEWPPLVADARLTLGTMLGDTGDAEQAEQVLAAAFFEASRAGVPAIAADAAGRLVHTVGVKLARHREALMWSQHAELASASLPDPVRTREASLLVRIAAVHRELGAYDEARTLHERALAIREEALGPDHPSVAGSLNSLAIVHTDLGAFDDSKALHRRALAIRENVLGPKHPEVATSLSNLAAVHDATGAHEEAMSLYRRALGIREESLGPQHPDVATVLNNMAIVHHLGGRYDQAERLHERALAIREKALDPNHPDVAQTLGNLAGLCLVIGDHERAEALYRRANAIDEKVFGPRHRGVATNLDNLAVVHLHTGRLDEAKALSERALSIREEALGLEHPEVATNLSNLANIHHASGAHDEALALQERALAIRREAFGPHHRSVAASLDALAELHHDAERYDEAKVLFGQALDISERALGGEHPALASALLGLVRVALAQDASQDAVPLAERALSLREKTASPTVAIAEARFLLAVALWDAGRERARARELARTARDEYREVGGDPTELAVVEAWLDAHGG
jgi:eukaryotic-like serine/threonine-protein kinase